ncbi:MAG: 2-oxoacid:ferredoxin oxidoreductase subunit beta [Acidobacteriia bacterium]|nr:2-oxoacid:ferredoxin oxidoreductase subunit beta [Terriglobia bacterium]MYG04398.1 2-oxoacid:ferredoxin oxidoreductase subunit beta [Terriglobia bacterium]MYK11262.1 2-oxoacid:ferredoxin oxidoreductase subunit beta [Terriglobia bacterium]
MSTATATRVKAPVSNRIGLGLEPYRGLKTTLCAGCGHNSISERIVECFFEMGIDPTQVIKLSGIGCSSKSPAYFLSMSHGFNSVHGRMPAVATGAVLANKQLMALGVSGDGDTASIGLGQFVHMMRRNVPIVYIIEDNGCYGLTKGQFSATANLGSTAKSGIANELPPIDTCGLAVQLGATFVARSFSGDKKQLQSILKAALAHRGTAVLDVVSPCVTFNDHVGSTKSYKYVRENKVPLQSIGFVPHFEEIHLQGEFAPGTVYEVEMHDGSMLRLEKLEEDYNPTSRLKALDRIELAMEEGQILTGVLYVSTDQPSFTEILNLDDVPLAQLGQDQLRPPKSALDTVMEELA